MAVFSVRFPDELWEEMKRLDVNWAEYVRKAIEEKVRAERLRRAAESMDRSRARTAGVPFESTAEIRKIRDQR